MSYRLLFGLVAPVYCAFLLVGCVYLAHDDWPEPPPVVADIPPLPSNALTKTQAPDFRSIKDTQARKQAFFEFFRPLIIAENLRQKATRDTFDGLYQSYQADSERFTGDHLALLSRLSQAYSVDQDAAIEEQLLLLDRRIGQLPEALVMAQAATESAWGTSRFAREGNNFFGQWCFSQGCGIVPKQRKQGAVHEVAKFDSPAHSVRAYFNNINSFSAYRPLRDIRAKLNRDETPVTAYALLAGLKKYSEKGDAYLVQLRSIIRQNKLEIR